MATLEKIRNKAGLLVIVVGIALFAFIIGDFLNSGSTFFRQSNEKVIEVNGEVIKIQDFQERVNEMVDMYKMQMGLTNVQEDLMATIRQSVFDTMVQEVVLDEATDKLGMTVSPEELFDMVQGENISPVIQQMQVFNNPETGLFDKNFLLEFLKAINVKDMQNYLPEQRQVIEQQRDFWLFWEKNIKRQRLEEKYTTLLSKAITANTLDAKEAYNENARSADIVFAMQPYSTIPDSAVQVSNKEIEKLYNQRKELYRLSEAKVIKYIAVDVVPSQEDYEKVSSRIESVKDEFLSSDDVIDIVNDHSDVPFTDVFVSANSMDAETRQFVTNAAVGEVYGPVFENDTYSMVKLLEKTTGPDSVRVAHIMFPNYLDDAYMSNLMDSLTSELKRGADFAAMAGEFSIDDQSRFNGGEMGWFTEYTALTGVDEAFKNAVFSLPVNQVAEVNTIYGKHIVKVLERTSNVTKYKLANIVMEVAPSSKTHSNLYAELNQFISKNRNSDSWADAAGDAGYIVSDASLGPNDQTVGTIRSSRQIVTWAYRAKKGDVSKLFECDDKLVVAALQGTIKEGYHTVKEVTPILRPEIANEKKGQLISSDLMAKNLNSIESYAQAMDTSVDSVKFVSFGTRRIAGIGIEPRMNAMVSLANEGQLSQPVIGSNGVYVFQVIDTNQEAAEYNEQQQVSMLNASNNYRYGFQSIQSLIKQAKVKDNRYRFY